MRQHRDHRGGHEFDGGHREGADGERRGGRGRMFDAGQMRLVVLHLLQERPLHGYELIRQIGELVGGTYSPSPGTMYPTLALLEELGLTHAASEDGGRKQYSITSEGRHFLTKHAPALEKVQLRLALKRKHAIAKRAPQIMRAMENLKTALRLQFEQGTPDADELDRIAGAIDRAAHEIARG